jgi:hypothetical protein
VIWGGNRFSKKAVEVMTMAMSLDPNYRPSAMARWMWDARTHRLPYRNLPGELRPGSIAEAQSMGSATP